MLHIRREVMPFIGIVIALGAVAGFMLNAPLSAMGFVILGTAYLIFFFRDPDRTPPTDSAAVLSGADGRVLAVTKLMENRYLNTGCVRISIFLSIFDVHVNRAPISGQSKFIGFFPGKKFPLFGKRHLN